MKSKILFCAALMVTSIFASSCDPDDIDAFADGYRQGYYSTRASEQIDDTANGDIDVLEQQ